MRADLPPLNLLPDPLPYESRLESRVPEQVDLVVIHCTELPDLKTAREFGESVLYQESGTGNSGHFYVDRDGSVHQYVQPRYVAHHTRGYNPRSIGIELVNTGRYPNWLDSRHQAMDEPYTAQQITALIRLLQELSAQSPRLQFIAGHEDLDTTRVPASDDPSLEVARKRDPGPQFPWGDVLATIRLVRLQAAP